MGLAFMDEPGESLMEMRYPEDEQVGRDVQVSGSGQSPTWETFSRHSFWLEAGSSVH